jgi:hypothetical protein
LQEALIVFSFSIACHRCRTVPTTLFAPATQNRC